MIAVAFSAARTFSTKFSGVFLLLLFICFFSFPLFLFLNSREGIGFIYFIVRRIFLLFLWSRSLSSVIRMLLDV